MDVRAFGAIDCDVHPSVPSTRALLPYLDAHWREVFRVRGIDTQDFESACYPAAAPLSGRPDWRGEGPPGADFDLFRREALDRFGSRIAICNVIHGAQALFNADIAAAFCKAINDWLAAEWLDRDPRLRASIVVPWQDPALAVAEIERRAVDPRFVQVLVLAMGETPPGRRHHWPIYEAAAHHGLPLGIHAGSAYRHAPTPGGWPASYLGDYIAFGNGFESALLSLIAEGVFAHIPELRVVLLESGVSWLPGFLWRTDKTWRGVRSEIPWVKDPPSDYVRRHVRLTAQPLDVPDDPAVLAVLAEQIDAGTLLLFATDFPHWQFDGDNVLPPLLAAEPFASRVLVENALATYPRLSLS
ncbi:MAG TPA: amidohydrolase family protein [Hyphomicrobiales bacterium]|nr:amidohydrolase family protein [Hyphomicrobiales bacterium]